MIVGLLLIAFLLEQVWLVGFVAIVMLVGTLWPKAGLFKLIYMRLLKPTGLLRPDVKFDESAPHLFAQGLGAVVLILSVLALLSGFAALGWLLNGIVILLAAVNLLLNFCLGCFIYYQLASHDVHVGLPAWRNI